MNDADMPHVPGIYLIHFDRPLKHAHHYVGMSRDIHDRIKRHRESRGASLLRALNKLHIGWTVVRIWTFDTVDEAVTAEHDMKKHHHSSRYCPICSLAAKQKKGISV